MTVAADRHRVFRERLIRLLMNTRWPRGLESPKDAQKLAKPLGVQPDVLVEARRRIDAEKAARSLEPIKGQKKNERQFPQLEIDMPEEAWNDWRDWCERQHAKPNALMRGALHNYLMGSWEPEWLSTHWRYKGKYSPSSPRQWEEDNKAAWPFRERVLVTRGAYEALHRRAKRMNKSIKALLRGIVLEILEGRLHAVAPMDSNSMFNDPLRYLKHIEAPDETS